MLSGKWRPFCLGLNVLIKKKLLTHFIRLKVAFSAIILRIILRNHSRFITRIRYIYSVITPEVID